jgi:hypothetical protein
MMQGIFEETDLYVSKGAQIDNCCGRPQDTQYEHKLEELLNLLQIIDYDRRKRAT